MAVDATPLVLSQLPVVVAGPLLRRLTREKITVWAALRLPDEVTLRVRKLGDAAAPTDTKATPLRVGKDLWIVALTASGVEGGEFRKDTLYEYWLEAAGWPAAGLPQWSTLRLDPAAATGFPAFLGLPDAVADMRIMHASCRKPHGGGRDALALGHELLVGAGARPRPNLLLLSGDQIYGDDVAAPLLPRIKRVATDLVGIAEPLFAPEPLLEGRAARTKSFGLTSDEAHNHLWTLGEFLAMYLLAWSDALWPGALPTWAQAAADVDTQAHGGKDELDEANWNALVRALELYRAGLPRIRRLLANVPSLMVFDDHEVTDDWNLDHAWVNKVYSSNEGRRIVVNALSAYLLCQHWGNRPEPFDNPTAAEGKAKAALTWSTSAHPDTVALRDLLGLPTGLPIVQFPAVLRDLATTQGVRYDYSLGPADGYAVRLVVLDERTARGFPKAGRTAERASPAALDQMFPAPATAPSELTLLVAPAPVLGTHLLEYVVQPAAELIPEGGAFTDSESWLGSGAAFERLLARMAAWGAVAVLSGDVHYGGARRLSYTPQGAGAVQRVIAQLTVGSSKNAETKTIALHVFGELMQRLAIERARDWEGFAQLPAAERAKLQSAPAAGTVLPYDDVADIALGRVLREGLDQPAVFSKEVARAYGLPTPDWQYRVEPFDDETMPADAQLKAAIEAPHAQGRWSGWDPAKSYVVLKALRASDLHRIGRTFVGLPQVGVISFSTSGNRFTVNQSLVAAVGEDAAAPAATGRAEHSTAIEVG